MYIRHKVQVFFCDFLRPEGKSFEMFLWGNKHRFPPIYYKMKKILKLALLLSLGILLPGVCTMLITGRTGSSQKKMGVQVTLENGEQVDGEEFVIGMAASELSYVKEAEALKAWMIVCRTNFMKAAGDSKEVNADKLALDYISQDELEKNNGRKAWLEINSRLEEASDETFGQALFYGGSLIDALYHPVSIGKTVSASEIYTLDVPYLISVDSSQDVESEDYMDVKILSYKDCAKKLKKSGFEETEEDCRQNLKITAQTENGYVQTVETKENQWTGEEWKEIFDLNSTNFYLENYGDRLRMVTIGKGHGMGMSLYGANVLARKELSAATILSYYYPGTETKDALSAATGETITKNSAAAAQAEESTTESSAAAAPAGDTTTKSAAAAAPAGTSQKEQ